MDLDKLFELATPYLSKNDFGVGHTKRVFDIAQKNFIIKPELKELAFASIILHDIGGSTIKEQYAKGPEIASKLLKKLGCNDNFIKETCEIIGAHHEHPENPSDPFKVLYDSDKIVMLTKEEYPHYNSKEKFDWKNVINLIYSNKGKQIATKMFSQRQKENKSPK